MGGQSDYLKQLQAQLTAFGNANYDKMVSGFNSPPAQNQQANPNTMIPSQYTRQAPSGGLMDGLSPMRMYQNRQDYQGQYGTPESLAPMQMLNQYRQTGAETGATPTATGSPGGK